MPKKFYLIIKRLLDLCFALFLAILLLPVILIIAALIKMDSRGPVLFKQRRTGYKGKEFEIWKFRSMMVDNDLRDEKGQDSYTRMGKILRITSLDELPQLFNILMGQMSFVGPRPWVVEYYQNMNERERQRVSVRPGMTGLAQVKGRNGLSVFERIGYDLIYVEKCSFLLDAKIVMLTVKAVLMHKSAEAGRSGVRDDISSLKCRGSE